MKTDSQIGKYKILSEIGVGGMGKVYLAYDAQLQRDVCLKILSEKLLEDEHFRQRFKQEALAVSALNHPNIITIFEISEDNEKVFIVTEYIKGETLRDLLDNSSLTLGDAVKIIKQVAEALAVAHEAGIIHRDIKPENIMIRKDGLVKILDFGVSKLVSTEVEETEKEAETRIRVHTSAGLVLGTLNYMSPEQARGYEVDTRTDIWSLGVVFYEILTGYFPFEGDTMSDIIAAILIKETKPLKKFNTEIPSELEQIVFKCLRKKRENRYQKIDEFLTNLNNFEESEVNYKDVNISKIPNKKSVTYESEDQTTRILPSQTTAKNSELFKRFGQRKLALYSVVLLGLIFAIGAGFWAYQNYAVSGSKVESIAVLPFENVDKNTETEYLSDGITESLINDFSQIQGLTVKARSSVFQYKGKKFDLSKIGNELNVDAILTGRISQTDDNISLNLELVDSNTGNLLLGETYKRKMNEIVNLQDEIVRDFSNKLRKNPTASDRQESAKNYTENSTAYQSYLKGRYYLNKRTKEDFEKAIQNFREAIDIEPTYALAYAGLSDCYTEMTYWSFGLPKEMMPKARAAAQKALELDETLAEAHASLAIVAEDYEWDFAKAETEYKHSIELNPNRAEVFDRYGGFLCEQKRFDEGLEKLDKAFELDPLSPGIEMSKAACLYQKRDYDKAISQLQKIIKSNPEFLPAFSLLGGIYIRKEMYDETVQAWLKNSPLENYSAEQVTEWKTAYDTSGIKGFLQKDIEFRKEKLEQGSNQTLFIAMQYANLGDKDKALNWLEKAFDEKHTWLGELYVDPAWDILRDEPRFQEIVKKIGF